MECNSLRLLYAVLAAAVFVNVNVHKVHAAFEDDSLSGSPNPQVCSGESKLQAADGTQKANRRTCNSIQLGEIPEASKMTSTIIVEPANEQQIKAFSQFDIVVKINNLDTGFFSDPSTEYYAFSQQLNRAGVIKGHTHVVIQKLFNTDSPPDASNFEFFKGLNLAASRDGTLTESVDKGLSSGSYRLCTMSSSFSHQSVVMPVAQRGAQDDCIRFSVI